MAGSSPGVSGIVLVDKAQGWTSHDVVARCRRLFNMKRIGHTGTLDPMATGLVVVCLGRATRLVEYMTAHDKRYEGIIQLGVSTATDDAEGEETGRHPVPVIDDDLLREIEAKFTGQLMQRPPAYSAVSVGGKRAYAVARAGGTLELAERPIVVHAIDLAVLDGQRLALNVHCGSGTYIRSIARDIGVLLGCGAHLAALRRTSAGGFDVAAAHTLERLAEVVAVSPHDALLPFDDGICDMPAALVDVEQAGRLASGLRCIVTPLQPGSGVSPLRVYGANGDFVGIGGLSTEGELRMAKVMAGAAELG